MWTRRIVDVAARHDGCVTISTICSDLYSRGWGKCVLVLLCRFTHFVRSFLIPVRHCTSVIGLVISFVIVAVAISILSNRFILSAYVIQLALVMAHMVQPRA